MKTELSYFILLSLLIAGAVWSLRRPKVWPDKWYPFRWKVLLVVIGVWLITACVLAIGYVETRSFFRAVGSGNISRVTQLLSEKPRLVQARTIGIWEEDTALHLASAAGNSNMAALLLRAGADVNATNSSGISPLHEAAFYGNASVAEILLRAGAGVNALGYRDKATPLSVAAAHGEINVVKVLLEHGANTQMTDRDGRTPVELARELGWTNVVNLLSDRK